MLLFCCSVAEICNPLTLARGGCIGVVWAGRQAVFVRGRIYVACLRVVWGVRVCVCVCHQVCFCWGVLMGVSCEFR